MGDSGNFTNLRVINGLVYPCTNVPVAAPSPAEIIAGKDAAASRPASWQAIEVGSLVIAHESHEDGWWEAIVVAVENDQLVLRWRDYARTPCVRRGRFEVALHPPAAA